MVTRIDSFEHAPIYREIYKRKGFDDFDAAMDRVEEILHKIYLECPKAGIYFTGSGAWYKIDKSSTGLLISRVINNIAYEIIMKFILTITRKPTQWFTNFDKAVDANQHKPFAIPMMIVTNSLVLWTSKNEWIELMWQIE